MKSSYNHLAALVVGLSAIGGYGCKRTAATIVEESVKTTKAVSEGISEGFTQGRKAAESDSGPQLVSSADELKGKGLISVHAVRGRDAGSDTEVDIVFENISDRPLTISKLHFEGFDREGFVKQPHWTNSEVTVPAHAKEKRTLTFDEPADSLAKVRYWNVEMKLP